MEQVRIQTQLIKLGVKIIPLHNLASIHLEHVELACIYTGQLKTLPCSAVVMVTMRDANDDLYDALTGTVDMAQTSITRIGDCLSPGTIAAAIYSGHRYARELGEPICDGVPFRRELPAFATD